MSLEERRKHFVPDDGISRAVLEDQLATFFGPGAQIGRTKIRLEKGGEVGWEIDGGRVTEAIIDDLRKETRIREQRAKRAPATGTPFPGQASGGPGSQRAPSSISSPLSRHGGGQRIDSSRLAGVDQFQRPSERYDPKQENIAAQFLPERRSDFVPPDQGQPFSPSNPGRHPPSDAVDSLRQQSRQPFPTSNPDRHTPSDAIDIPRQQSRQPAPSSFVSHNSFTDRRGQPFSPSNPSRHPPSDVVDIPRLQSRQSVAGSFVGQATQNTVTDRHGQPTTANTDPAYAAKHTEHDFTQTDFQDYQKFQEFLRLRRIHEQKRALGRDGDDEDPDAPGTYGHSTAFPEAGEPRARRDESPTDHDRDAASRRPGDKKKSKKPPRPKK